MKGLLLIAIFLPFVGLAQIKKNTDDIYEPRLEAKESTSTIGAINSVGSLDAKKYYKGYKGAGTSTLIVSIINPILGLAPAIGLTSGTPLDLMYPNEELMKDQKYRDDYIYTAKKIRSRKVWRNWGVGLAFNAVVGVVVYTVISSANNDNNSVPTRKIPGF